MVRLVIVLLLFVGCKRDEGDVYPYPVEVDMVGDWQECIEGIDGGENILFEWYFRPDGSAVRFVDIHGQGRIEQDMFWEYVEPSNISGASQGLKITYVMSTPSGCVPCFFNMYFQNARVKNQKRLVVKYSEGCSRTYDKDRNYIFKRL